MILKYNSINFSTISHFVKVFGLKQVDTFLPEQTRTNTREAVSVRGVTHSTDAAGFQRAKKAIRDELSTGGRTQIDGGSKHSQKNVLTKTNISKNRRKFPNEFVLIKNKFD